MIRRPGWAGPYGRRAVVGAAIGATIWISQGVLAVVDPARMTRIGALADWPWMVAWALAGAVLGAALRVPAPACAPIVLLTLLWLPWAPLRVPPAFLMWDGPLEGAVWTTATVGVVWLTLRRRPRLRGWFTPSPARAPWIVAALMAVVLAASWAIVRPRVPAGDEPHYLVIAQSLLRDGDLRIENNHREDQYLEYFEGALKPDFMQRGTDGEIYSIHAPGIAALVAPAFRLAGYFGAVATVIVVSALGLALTWQAAFLLTGSRAAAWIGWLAIATAAPFVLHGFTIYPDPVGATLAIAGVLALVSLEVAPERRRRSVYWVATGAALALLPWLHARFALVAAVLGVALALRLVRRPEGWRDAVRLLSVPAVAAVAWFAYFWTIYGTPNPAAPYGSRPDWALGLIPNGLAGLLVDQQFGLAVNAPILLLALAAFVPLARRRRRLAVELAVAVVPYLLTVASYPMWWGGYSAPARFAVIVLPLLAVPLAHLWSVASSAGRGVMAGLLAASAGITVALVGVDRGAFVYNGRDGYSVLLDWLSRTVDLTLALPSVHRDGAAAAVADFTVWAVAGVLIAAVAILMQRKASPGLARAAGWAAVPGALMLAATVTWAGHDRDAVTASTSQMRWLEHWVPESTPLAVQLTPTRALTPDAAPRRLSLGTSLRGPRRAAAGPLLQIPLLPAGEYDLFIDGRGGLTGTLVVRLGRQDVPMETWQLDGHRAGLTGLVLRLPADAHSVAVSGDDAARASARRLTLTPRRLVARATARMALRAARYGGVVVFALDDYTYLEPTAQWVRGERATSLIVQPDDGRPVVAQLRTGPIANVVTLSAGTWRAEVRLDPEATAEVTLPDEARAPAVLTISSATGFRPSAYIPGSRDVRWLGAYLTWSDTPARAGR